MILSKNFEKLGRTDVNTDDVNQCLHNKSGSHGVPNANLFNFKFLPVDFGSLALCSSANEHQQISNASSREECNKIFHKYIIDCFAMDSSRLNL